MSKKITTYFIIISIFLIPLSLSARYFARWWTTMGSFTADLRDEIVPITANNFISLTNSGFYDGLHFHRVVAGFVIQDGDPLGTGYGGPNYTIQDEFSPLLHHDSAGVLAMAHSSLPNSAGSQYYITLAPTPDLDGNYAIFGKVFQGLDVVLNIGQVEVDSVLHHPINNVYIDSLKILNMVINSVSPSPDSVVAFDSSNPISFVLLAYGQFENVLLEWYIDDVLQPQFTDIIMDPVFTTTGMHTAKCVASDSELTWSTTWQVDVSTVSIDDQSLAPPDIMVMNLYPNPFRDKTTIVYNLKENQPVSISIYDVKGRIVKSEKLYSKAGINQWTWNVKDEPIATGVYFLKINTEGSYKVQKVFVIK